MKSSLIYIILLLQPLTLFAGDYDTKYSGSIDTTIDHVVTGGLWQHKEDYGRWRIISRNIGWEHTRSYIYLQWLVTNDKKQQVLELKTVPIKEFNESNWRHLNKIEYKNDKFIIYYSVRGEKSIKKSILIPGNPGVYKIKL